jgi:hypothetical protein
MGLYQDHDKVAALLDKFANVRHGILPSFPAAMGTYLDGIKPACTLGRDQ